MSVKDEDVGVVWEDRAFVYRLLAVACTLPDQRFVDALGDGSLVNDMGQGACLAGLFSDESITPGGKQAFDRLATYAPRATLSDLRREYTRLFSGPAAVVPIWEASFCQQGTSWSGESNLLIRSREAVDAQRRYREAGVEVTDGESADHMKAECAFAAFLCEQVMAPEDERELALFVERYEHFVSTHLARWLPSFFRAVCRETDNPCYHLIGMIGSQWGASCFA